MASVCAGNINDTVMSENNNTSIDFPMIGETVTDDLKINEGMISTGDIETFQTLQNNLQGSSLTPEDDGYVHIYVNASASLPGNGTKDSPYQSLSSVNQEFRDKTVLHIANGYYNYNNSGNLRMFAYTDVKFIGESAKNTTLDFCGEGIFAFIEWTPNLYFENIRLFNTSVNLISKNGQRYSGGKMEAVNVTFENSKSIASNDQYYIGGAISCSGQLELTNCIFKNNSAERGGAVFALIGGEINNCTFIDNIASEEGGAIFVSNQEMKIFDSLFINNTALDGGGAIYTIAKLSINHSNFEENYAVYGGAIASVQSQYFYLNNVNFINDSAKSSAGAVYSMLSKNYFYNSHFINCSSLIGGAICDLDSFSLLSGLNFTSNRATKGGAVYKMYNAISINDSAFISNQAHDGGSLYVDEVDSAVLNDIILDNNTADYGEDIYCLGDVDNINLTEVDSANMFNITFLSLIQRADDYNIFEINDTSVVFESRYDMRDYGYLTEVKDQEIEGNCWAFAALAALESCIIKANGTVYDLSEENLKNLMAKFSDYGNSAFNTDNGGNMYMSIGYLTSWLGPVYDEEDIYSSNSVSLLYDVITHVQNVIFIPRTSLSENDNIKEAIMKYGAVVTSMYYSSAYLGKDKMSYYVNTQSFENNHAVTIVGWDDNYSKENFKTTPPGDGAFIVRNSWGPDWGENGYFYVSYYDLCFARVNNIYYPLYTFVLNDTNRYDKNYQHEILISNLGTVDANPIYIGNSFIAEDDELISAVSTYFGDNSDYEIRIFVNDELKHSQFGNTTPGYFTIPLTKYVPVKEGDIMDIMFVITSLNQRVPLLYFFEYCKNPRINQTGVSFYSADGIYWYDIQERYDYVLAIKGFTKYGKLNTTLEVIGLDSDWTVNKDFNLAAEVKDQFGDYIGYGNVTFLIDGVEYSVDLNNGTANKTVSFNQAGKHNISVLFSPASYYYPSSISKSINIDPVSTALSLSLSKNVLFVGDSLYVNAVVNATQGKVDFYINGILKDTIYVNSSGVAVLALDGLSYGNYNLTAFFTDERGTYLNSSNKTTFNVLKLNPELVINTHEAIYGQNAIIALIYNNNATGKVNVTIIGEKYNGNFENLNLNKIIVLPNDIPSGEYSISVTYSGDDTFLNTTANSIFTILKANSTLNVNNMEFDYNKTGYVTLSYTNASGVIAQVIDHDEAIVNISDSMIAISNLNAGKYTLNVTTITDDNHNPITKTSKITVNKINSTISISEIILNYGESVNVNVTTTGATNITAKINDKNTPVKGNVIPISGLNAGIYTLTVTTIPDANHNPTTKKVTVTVNKVDSSLVIDDVELNYDDSTELSVLTEGALGIKAKIGNKDIAVSDFKIPISGLNAGIYTLIVTTIPDANHNPTTKNATVTINKIDSTLTINDVKLNYGDTTEVSALTQGAIGIKAKIGSENATVKGNIIIIPPLDAGNYTLIVTTIPDANHNPTTKNATVTINKIDSTLTINDVKLNYGDTTEVSALTQGAIGIKAKIGNENATVKGNIIIIPPLATGTHTLTVTTIPDKNHDSITKTARITVNKLDTILTAKYDKNSKNIVATIKDAKGKVVSGVKVGFDIDGLKYVVTDDTGQAKYSTKDLEDKYYSVNVIAYGNEIYKDSNKETVTFDLTKIVTTLTSSDVTDDYNGGKNLVATLKDANGKVIKDAKVTVKLGNIAKTLTTDSNGQVSLSLNGIIPDVYTATISFDGDDIYKKSSTTAKVTINKLQSKVYLRNALYFVLETKMVKVTLWDANNKPLAGKTVHITLDEYNLTYSGVTDENGTATIRVGVGFGVHSATVSFDGDDIYSTSHRTGSIRVIKETPSVMVRGVDTQFRVSDNPKIVKVYLWDRTSKPLPAGSKIVIKINGQTCVGYTDNNGIASIKININKAGNYNAEVAYGGNSAYNAVTRPIKIVVR